ncbi:hypothetical protein C8R45DRAFT_948122 [Mycena sanguinolenta]|nr:hypothetical protein C8R45DRAFT_948122 [Mycena sanguinolenta]
MSEPSRPGRRGNDAHCRSCQHGARLGHKGVSNGVRGGHSPAADESVGSQIHHFHLPVLFSRGRHTHLDLKSAEEFMEYIANDRARVANAQPRCSAGARDRSQLVLTPEHGILQNAIPLKFSLTIYCRNFSSLMGEGWSNSTLLSCRSTNQDRWTLAFFWIDRTVDGQHKIDKLVTETWKLSGSIKPLAYIRDAPGTYFFFTAGGQYYLYADGVLKVHKGSMEFGEAG